MNVAYIGLGSNIHPETNMPDSIKKLAKVVDIESFSSIWRTPPIHSDGPFFLNAVVRISTTSNPHTLKEKILCPIEYEMGRVRVENKNAPRTIDLDILIFNSEIIEKNIFIEDYLVFPLSELLPSLQKPGSNLTLKQIADSRYSQTQARIFGKFTL